LRRKRVAEVRRWLDNYQKLKEAIEAICELNHGLMRPEARVRTQQCNRIQQRDISDRGRTARTARGDRAEYDPG